MALPSDGETLLDVQGTQVHLEGRGQALLMVHGWPDTWRLWDAQVAALRRRHRCVRFSLPGFEPGDTVRQPSLEDLVGLIAAVADAASPGKPVTLLVHDWGCVFGYEYARRHRFRVARIIGLDIGDVASPAYLRSLPLSHKAMIAGYQGWLAAAWRAGGSTGDRMTRWMAHRLGAPCDGADVSARMNYPYHLQWTGGLRGMAPFEPHCPMLYVYGERKPVMFHSPQWFERVRATEGGAVYAWPSGHWVMRHDTDAFNALLAKWLAATSPR